MEISWIAALQLTLLITVGKMLAFGFLETDERKCKYSRVERMMKIRCYDMNLKEVPQYLKSSVEVFDLSFNRIKKLKRSSFQQYKSVKFLLLYENMIQSVEPGTFADLTSLQEIDLSNNALMTIPLEIFQLPSLRNLYVDSNELIYLDRDLEALETPINAPLEYLNIAECSLEDLPDLGLLPKLWHINASSNPLNDLSIHKFASFCNLKSIDLSKTHMTECSCQQVNSHLRYTNVKTKYVPVCLETLNNNICPLPFNYTVDSETYQSCKRSATIAEARGKWIFAVGCLGGVFVVLMLVWYLLHRGRKRRERRKKAAQYRKPFVISPKNAINPQRDDELLNCDNA